MDVQFSADAAEQAMAAYPGRVQRATVRALNRALTSGRALLASLVAKDMGLKVGAAKEAIRVRKATPATMEISLKASLKRLPLTAFGARQTRAGVSYKSAASGRQTLPSGFLAAMPSGHVGVFTRRGKSRLPIQERFGPSIGHVFYKHRAAGIAQMKDVFETNLTHELAFASTETTSE